MRQVARNPELFIDARELRVSAQMRDAVGRSAVECEGCSLTLTLAHPNSSVAPVAAPCAVPSRLSDPVWAAAGVADCAVSFASNSEMSSLPRCPHGH